MMKENITTIKPIQWNDNSEDRQKELMYMSQYMALILRKEKYLAALKRTG